MILNEPNINYSKPAYTVAAYWELDIPLFERRYFDSFKSYYYKSFFA